MIVPVGKNICFNLCRTTLSGHLFVYIKLWESCLFIYFIGNCDSSKNPLESYICKLHRHTIAATITQQSPSSELITGPVLVKGVEQGLVGYILLKRLNNHLEIFNNTDEQRVRKKNQLRSSDFSFASRTCEAWPSVNPMLLLKISTIN